MIDGSDDFIGVGGPDEGLRVMVGLGDEAVDGGLEVDDRAKDAALEAAPGEFGEEALDGIEPRARGRGEVEDETRADRRWSWRRPDRSPAGQAAECAAAAACRAAGRRRRPA